MEGRRPKTPLDRNKIILIIQFMIVGIIGMRLFYLQLWKSSYYQAVAAKEHAGYTELPARRGEIFLKDYHSEDLFRIATNTTLDLLYVDPTLVKSPQSVVDTLEPLIYDAQEAQQTELERVQEAAKKLDPNLSDEEKKKLITPKTGAELEQAFRDDLLQKVTSVIRPQILLSDKVDTAKIQQIREKNIIGVEATDNSVYVYPPKITNVDYVTNTLGEILGTPPSELAKVITTKNRYVVLKKKLQPEISDKIKELVKNDKQDVLAGIGMQEEYYRYYPEKDLAANIVGYVNPQGNGLYGIESKFNVQLKGKNGIFEAQKDSIGRQITVGQSVIQPAVDGDDIVLTLDRSIQMELDHQLQQTVTNTRSDSGLAIVMEVKTGRILGISHYPTFDPNDYGQVFEKEPIQLTPEEIDRLKPIDEKSGYYSLVTNETSGVKLQIFKETNPDGTVVYKKYKNDVGPEAYQNKAVAWDYEPGSVFKPIAMSAAIDDKDVTPNTVYNDTAPVKTDEYEIKNALNKYYGPVTMRQVLANSLNTGMSFVARKIGRNLFYNYIMRFGFGSRTDIEFDDEHTGKIAPYTQWAESELLTHAFGQGLTVTPIQMVTSYAAIANGGLRMQPYIVEEIKQKNGKITQTEPHPVEQVVSSETASMVKSMLVEAVESGVALHAQVSGHYVAAKTGTAQTYYRGKPLFGVGTTIGTVVGFAPIDNPKFAILIKLDRMKQSEWADATAAPMFSRVAEFLFNYFNIPPDKKAGIKNGTIGSG